MASSARHLFLLAFVAVLAVVAPRGADAWGGRLFFSKTTRPEAAAVETEKVAAAGATTAVPYVTGPNSATTFSRPSTGGGGGRGYGLYGRPEENFPPAYFRRGVHHDAEKLTTTSTAEETAVPVGGVHGERVEPLVEDNGSGRGRPPWTTTNVQTTTAEETVPVGGRGERAEPFVEDNGSGRGRPPWTTTNVQTTSAEETVPVGIGGRGERAEPFVEDNGSGRGRPPWYYGPDADGRPEEQRNYGMSDTRLYQNGRYYYDVGTGRYGYGGRESNPMRTREEEFGGRSGFFGRAGERRGRYGNVAGYQYGNVDNEFGNGVIENQSGFQEEEGRDGRYIP